MRSARLFRTMYYRRELTILNSFYCVTGNDNILSYIPRAINQSFHLITRDGITIFININNKIYNIYRRRYKTDAIFHGVFNDLINFI